ncbi:MAG: hypothetical protein ABI459_10190 [Deltaproteobacteria bacterium]
MLIKLISTTALAVTLFAASAQAATTLYECKIATSTNATGNWIVGPVLIAYVDGAKQAKVSDPVSQSAKGKPIDADVKSENAAKITFGWLLTQKSVSGQYVKMNYRASIINAGNKIAISATPLGYANTFRGDGTCKVSRKN